MGRTSSAPPASPAAAARTARGWKGHPDAQAEFYRRNRITLAVFPLIWAALLLATDIPTRFPEAALFFGAGHLGIALVRLWQSRGFLARRHDERQRQWHIVLALVLLAGSFWGATLAWVVHTHGMGLTAMLAVICTGAMIAGGTASIAVDRRAQITWSLTMTVPFLVVCVLRGEREWLALAVATVFYLSIMAIVGHSIHRVYWKLKDSLAALERANRAKNDFLGLMSHELRTPLTSIIGISSLLAQQPRSERERRLVQNLQDAGESLHRLINDLLDLSRLEAGGIEIRRTPVEIEPLITTALDAVLPRARNKGLTVHHALSPELPRSALLDRLRVSQILSNLLDNAVKFTEAGEILLTVDAAQSAAGPELVFSVTDTGPGVAEDRASAVFEAFTQGEEGTQRRFGGTGLGLTISRDLARRMGGQLVLETTSRAGSRFTLRLPLREQGALPPTRAARPHVRLVPHGEHAPIRLLVAEDRQAVRDLYRAALEEQGFAVRFAVHGADALAQLEEGPGEVDAILMDLEMPVMDGLEASRRISRHADPRLRAIPIVIVSAHATGHHRQQALSAGAREFIAKPVDFGRLFTRLRHLAESPREPSEA